MLAHVSRLAPLDRPILLAGERGTGKELVAGRLAFLSPRWDRPFIKLNCAALAELLLDAELFGHEAGAFTGAARRRAGRFELADGGTLFLDEIASAAPAVQEKLLRVIEYGTFERIGGSETLEVDVRVVAATNADLPALAAAGRFRADLLDRLAFDVVTLPPLRERERGYRLAGRAFRHPHDGRTAPALLRRLRAVGARSAARASLARQRPRASQRRGAQPLPGRARRPAAREDHHRSVRRHPVTDRRADGGGGAALRGRLDDFAGAVRRFETRLLERALAELRHNQRRAAARLGLSYDQFRRRLKATIFQQEQKLVR